MAGFDLSEASLMLNCRCGIAVPFTIGQAAREETIVCPDCGTKINLVDNNGSNKKAIRDINQSIDDLDQSLKRLSRG